MAEEPTEGAADEVIQASEGRGRKVTAVGRLTEELREGRVSPMLVSGFIAWAITVLPAGFGRSASILAGILSVLSLAACVGGPLVLVKRPRLGRHLGISLFVGFAAAVWLTEEGAIHPLRLEPIRGSFGAIAWGVFAVSWSDRWGPRAQTAPPDPGASALLARATLPPLAAPITAVGVAAGLGYLVYAFQIHDPDRALVGQAVALLCAVTVVTAAATVATIRGKHRSAAGPRLTSSVVRALVFLVTFAVAGAIVAVLR